tara:strand:+ start:1623 stop:2261 length:639 start_codon:yes stop_codon:yes gene_type:complete
MSRRILIVTAVQEEAQAIGDPDGALVITGGIGKTNAAAATTAAILSNGPFAWVINAGVAGALPTSNLAIGDVVIANESVYTEEGLLTNDGFKDIDEMGFTLGSFKGNRVPSDNWMCERLSQLGKVAPIATVATCSGTNAQAELVAKRTQAVCEAMEGAAVLHAAKRLGIPGLELRVISNSTGNRETQDWNMKLAIHNLGDIVNQAIDCILRT